MFDATGRYTGYYEAQGFNLSYLPNIVTSIPINYTINTFNIYVF